MLLQLCRCPTEFHSVTEIETDDWRFVGVAVEMDDHRLGALPSFHVEVRMPRGKSVDARIGFLDGNDVGYPSAYRVMKKFFCYQA